MLAISWGKEITLRVMVVSSRKIPFSVPRVLKKAVLSDRTDMETVQVRILLVDDDPIFSDIVIAKLATYGHADVTRARSAEHALELVDQQRYPFDCYLLDIMLGDMDGIELCRNLRLRRDCKSAPVIMITASQEAPLMGLAFQAGATDFLRKPLNEAEFSGRITTAKLVFESMQREKKGRDALQALISSGPNSKSLQDGERVCFSDVPGMVDYHELENRLLRLEDGFYQLSVFRIRIRRFRRKIGQNADRAVILRLLHAVSVKVADVVPTKSLLLAYIGRGRFICCIVGRQSKVSGLFQSQLQIAACEALEKFGVDNSDREFDISQLNERHIVTKAAAIALVRNEFDLISAPAAASLPDVDAIEDIIIDRTARLVRATPHRQ